MGRLLIGILVTLFMVGPAVAVPSPPIRCEQLKLGAAGKAAGGILRCHAKAASVGLATSADCLDVVTEKLTAGFAKAELKHVCAFTGEAPAVDGTLRAVGADLRLATGTAASTCARKKILAGGKRMRKALIAQSKHTLQPERALLGAALAKIATKFTTQVDAAERAGDCATYDDAPVLATRIDAANADVVDAVRGTLAAAAARTGRRAGAAVRANVLASMEAGYRDTIVRQFDDVTLEYELMWGNLEPTPGNYLFGPVDTTVEFAEHYGLGIKGAPLVWHLILPPWVNASMTPAELQAAVDERIDTLMGTYAGRITTWDVVNEATTDGGGAYRDSLFLQKLGTDYIRNAFIRARQADPNALLFYNDFLAEGVNLKSNFIYTMIAGLLAQGTPIDGVGFQMHLAGIFGPVPTRASVIQNLQRFADLGLRIRLTEMDVQTHGFGFGGEMPERMAAQRAVYHEMVAACVAVSACESVTFWGLTDKYTWIDDYLGLSDLPLPFDHQYRPKAAFFGVRDAFLGF